MPFAVAVTGAGDAAGDGEVVRVVTGTEADPPPPPPLHAASAKTAAATTARDTQGAEHMSVVSSPRFAECTVGDTRRATCARRHN